MAKEKQFQTLEEEVKWFVKNEKKIKESRKRTQKNADAVNSISFMIDDRGERVKAEDATSSDNTLADNGKIRVKVVINTTNLYDSHGDVHGPGLWKKSLQEKKQLFLCYEHDLSYKGIMSDVVKAYTENIKWSDLGFKYDGETEALIFECEILKEDLDDIGLEFMYKRYRKGKVYNHSVRMQYVKEMFCWKNEYPDGSQYNDNYEKYIEQVANKEEAENAGRFWWVTEARVIEGSSVVRGSNCATPTLEIEECENKSQAEENTLEESKNEPSADTQNRRRRN